MNTKKLFFFSLPLLFLGPLFPSTNIVNIPGNPNSYIIVIPSQGNGLTQIYEVENSLSPSSPNPSRSSSIHLRNINTPSPNTNTHSNFLFNYNINTLSSPKAIPSNTFPVDIKNQKIASSLPSTSSQSSPHTTTTPPLRNKLLENNVSKPFQSLPLSKKKTFNCGHCTATYEDHEDLKKHLFSHINQKPLTCSICSSIQLSETDLAQHIQKKHTNIKLKKSSNSVKHVQKQKKTEGPFYCPICRSSFKTSIPFKTKGRYKNHIRKHIEKEKKKQEKFTCHQCSKSFENLVDAKKHHIDHQKGSTFECVYCNTIVFEEDRIQRHLAQCTKRNGQPFEYVQLHLKKESNT